MTSLIGRLLPPGSGVIFRNEARRRWLAAFAGSLGLALVEVCGMTALLLLLQGLTGGGRPEAVTAALNRIGASDDRTIAVVLTAVVFLTFTGKAVLGLLFRRWMLAAVQRDQADTARRLLEGYLYGPYYRLKDRNTADFVRVMYDGTSSVFGLVVGSIVQAVVDAVTVLALVLFLVVNMPLPTLAALAFFAVAVMILQAYVRPRASLAGEELVAQGLAAYRATFEALAGAKEIKVRGTEAAFVEEFAAARHASGRAGARAAFLGELPRFVLEMLFLIVVMIVAVIVWVTQAPGGALTSLGLFVVAGIRMLPTSARIVSMTSAVRSAVPMMERVIRDLIDDLDTARPEGDETAQSRTTLRDSLVLEDVAYTYPGAREPVLDGVSLTVPVGTSVALVGTSGAGKSTLVDVILGLLTPDRGRVLADGVPITHNERAWRASIGLVPQDVFLLDASLASNLALGCGPDRVTATRMLAAISQARLEDFVAQLPLGLESSVGERGSRVSGGQRQRIGIARALCIDPTLLVLDEATSALDNDTEQQIVETLAALRGELTTVVVAHRLSTIQSCDRVAFLDRGRISAVGTFEELLRSSPAFAKLVALTASDLDG